MRTLLPFFLVFYCSDAMSQNAYKQGEVISNFSTPNILNISTSATNFNSLKKELSIIDFFGTWCVPCIRALPNLRNLQEAYPGRLAVVLVSTESIARLNKFISSQQKLSFPVIVDSDSSISNLFMPPAYPYTVVINKQNKIVAITEAEGITNENITHWLNQDAMNTVPIKQYDPAPLQKTPITIPENKSSSSINELSEQLVYAAKTSEPTTALIAALKNLDFDNLKNKLNTDDKKMAFWINLYNGFTQLMLKTDPDKYKNRNKFFKAKEIEVAGKQFSLDEIEHDILRRSKIKWSLGYFNKLFPGQKAKQLRVAHLNYRIHFALNCGAKSCPPIAFYQSTNIQSQLDIATRAYLTGECEYNADNNSLHLPAIMGWFRRDFNGKKRMLELVKKYNIVPQSQFPVIYFKKYDWSIYLSNYKN